MEIQKDDSKIDKTRGNKLITLHLILTQELKVWTIQVQFNVFNANP